MDGFRMPDSEPTRQYLHDICLCDRNTGKVFYEYLEVLRHVGVLKNMSGMDKLPVYLRKPIFDKLFAIAENGLSRGVTGLAASQSYSYRSFFEKILTAIPRGSTTQMTRIAVEKAIPRELPKKFL